MAIKNIPIQCKLTDFGKSRSLIRQTRTVLATRTKHMQCGTLLFMEPEQLPVKYPIKQAKEEDLLKVDIWQLGITLFCLVNPGLNAPFNIEFDKMTDICKLCRCWEFASNVGPMLFSARHILEPNIRGTSYVLACESRRSTIIGGCKGLHWKKKRKNN